jgi:hypothetical protein
MNEPFANMMDAVLSKLFPSRNGPTHDQKKDCALVPKKPKVRTPKPDGSTGPTPETKPVDVCPGCAADEPVKSPALQTIRERGMDVCHPCGSASFHKPGITACLDCGGSLQQYTYDKKVKKWLKTSPITTPQA